MLNVPTRRSLHHFRRLYSTEAPTGDGLRQAFSYCVNQVRSHDYENYLWCTQLTKELRAPILALRAFNVETALIGDHAKSDMLIMMRSQWWRDAVNAAYKGQAPDQPVMRALGEVMQNVQLTRYRLQRIISTREEDMFRKDALQSLQDVENYAEGTASQLLYLQLEAANAGSTAADHTASHAGKAVGIAGLLRGTLHHSQNHKTYLPIDLCEKHGVSPHAIIAGDLSPGVQDVVHEIASAAMVHLNSARAQAGESLSAAARPLLMPTLAAGMYLKALENAQFNPLDVSLVRGGYTPLQYQLKLKWNLFRGAL